MKKIGIVFSVLLLSAFLTACSNPEGADVDISAEPAQTAGAANDAETSEGIPETILYEENGIIIKAISLSAGETTGPVVDLAIENNGDKQIGVWAFDVSVNGYMITPLISAAAMPGEKTNASLSFPEDELIACGIETIAEITLCLNIYDIGRYENLYRTGPITISTSAAEAFTQVRDDTGDVLYNENGVKIVYKQAAAGITGPSYALYIENNTDRRISVQTRDETVNGTSVRPGFTCYIGPGKAAIRSMEFLKSELTDNGILDVSEVKLKFVVYDNDSDDFDAIAVSGAVVIDP